MKVSDFRGEDAILVMSDLLEPISYMLGDKETADFYKKYMEAEKRKPIKFVKFLLKHHSEEVLQIFAILNGIDIEDIAAFSIYKLSINPVTLIKDLLDFINDQEIQNLFQSQGLSTEETSSISATENTEA